MIVCVYFAIEQFFEELELVKILVVGECVMLFKILFEDKVELFRESGGVE